MNIQFDCPRCARTLRVAEQHAGKKVRCPECGAVAEVSAGEQPSEPTPSATPPVSSPGTEEGAPGTIPVIPSCPKCGTELAREAVLCIDCGYNLQTGKRLKTRSRSQQQDERCWIAGMQMDLRIGGYVLLLVPIWLFGVWAVRGDPIVGISILVIGTALFGFVFGTFIRLRLVRKGQSVQLTKTLWLSFIPAIQTRVNVRRFRKIAIDETRGFSLLHTIGFFLIRRPSRRTLLLALATANERESVSLCRLWDLGQMRDMVEAFQEMAGLEIVRR